MYQTFFLKRINLPPLQEERGVGRDGESGAEIKSLYKKFYMDFVS